MGKRVERDPGCRVARVGVVQFSDNAKTEIPLTSNATKLESAAESIRQMSGGTNMAAGLSLAQTEPVQLRQEQQMKRQQRPPVKLLGRRGN